MIRLTTLGTVRLAGDDGVELPIAGQQPKRLALLAYLAIARPRAVHRRDTILALLWPELDQEHGRAALRQALHSLRKALGPGAVVSTGNESIAIDRDVVSCDLGDLEDAVAAANHARALRLYEGELLAGLFVSDAPAFEQWLDAERTRVRSLVRECAWAEAESAAVGRRSADAVRFAQFALSLSDLDERAVRRAMRLIAGVGERATAVSLYEGFAATLRRELDTEPSEATRATVAALRRSDRAVPDDLVGDDRPNAAVVVGPITKSTARPAAVALRSRRFVRSHRIVTAAGALLAIAAVARLAPSATSALDPRRVRVDDFDNETAVTSFDTLARAVSLSTRGALLRLDNVRVVAEDSRSSTFGASVGGTNNGTHDAGTIVRGVVRVAGDSVEIRADVVDLVTGSIVRSIVSRAPRGTAPTTSAIADAFGDRVSAAVATALYPGWGSALSQPPSYAGYRRFLDGMRNIKRERHDLAALDFRRAYDEDTTFTAAGLLAASEYYQMRRYAAAESIATAIAARRAMLPVVDGYLLDWLERSLGGDRIAARTAMAAIVAVAPTAELAWLQLAIDNVETARPREALAALDRIDAKADFGDGWAAYWATRLEALHIAGDHKHELTVARDGLRRHPELRVLAHYELRALAALGRSTEIEHAAAALGSAPEVDGFDPRAALRQSAIELAAHGNPRAAGRVLASVRAWYTSRPTSEQSTLGHQLSLARTAYLMDDRREAKRLYSLILRDRPRCLDCVGALGVLAARDGDRVLADSSRALLATASRPFLFGRHLAWQARIAATLGDRVRARSLVAAAYASGAEFDVMTHADADLREIRPDSIYRAFARVGN